MLGHVSARGVCREWAGREDRLKKGGGREEEEEEREISSGWMETF